MPNVALLPFSPVPQPPASPLFTKRARRERGYGLSEVGNLLSMRCCRRSVAPAGWSEVGTFLSMGADYGRELSII